MTWPHANHLMVIWLMVITKRTTKTKNKMKKKSIGSERDKGSGRARRAEITYSEIMIFSNFKKKKIPSHSIYVFINFVFLKSSRKNQVLLKSCSHLHNVSSLRYWDFFLIFRNGNKYRYHSSRKHTKYSMNETARNKIYQCVCACVCVFVQKGV